MVIKSICLLTTVANMMISVPIQNLEQLLGSYQRLPIENPWHEGQITFRGKRLSTLRWTNQARVSWDLFPDLEKSRLETGQQNPYYQSGLREFILQFRDGKMIGSLFGSDLFVVAEYPEMAQLSGGLKGYISMGLPPAPEGFGYGIGFYAGVWSLIDQPSAGFQIGLPSTWITPDNRDFKQPLWPPGTVWWCLFSSRAEAAPPLESGTTWRQVTYGTLGMTLSAVPYLYMLEKSQPIQDRFKSENPTFLGRCVLKGLAITTVVGPVAIMELCARGIELGYRQQYGNQYRGNMWKTRTAVALGIPIACVGVDWSLMSVGMMPGVDPGLPVLACASACLSIPLAFLALPSFLGARSYNKSLKKKPIEAEINILGVAF
jgi:hypothetical protein